MPETADLEELSQSLATLVQQIDVAEYRDKLGHPLKNNLAYIHAQGVVDRFGVSHEQICKALERYADSPPDAARHLAMLKDRERVG